MGWWEYHDESSPSDGPVWMALLVFVFMIIGFITSVFAAFMAVGVVWGVFTSIRNYCLASGREGRSMGRTISQAWDRNVASMNVFFDASKSFTQGHTIDKLVKSFLSMSGIGVIVVGTVCMPVWMAIHALVLFVTWPFRAGKKNSAELPEDDEYVRDPKLLDEQRAQLRLTEGSRQEETIELTKDEQEYQNLYTEYAEEGVISDRDRKMLDMMREKMGIPKARARVIENLVPIAVLRP